MTVNGVRKIKRNPETGKSDGNTELTRNCSATPIPEALHGRSFPRTQPGRVVERSFGSGIPFDTSRLQPSQSADFQRPKDGIRTQFDESSSSLRISSHGTFGFMQCCLNQSNACEVESAREFVWVQEEPGNMGSRAFVIPRLERLARLR